MSQIKLLRLLQERTYFPVGADAPRETDARILVATNQTSTSGVNLDSSHGLYFRLNRTTSRSHRCVSASTIAPAIDTSRTSGPLSGKRKPTPPRSSSATWLPTPSPQRA